jgi:hypothetical protein
MHEARMAGRPPGGTAGGDAREGGEPDAAPEGKDDHD